MKITLLIIAILLSFISEGNSLAAGHPISIIEDRPQPGSDTDKVISRELAEVERLEGLLLQLADPDPFVRVEAVQDLGEIHEQRSLAAVSNSLQDENIYVRAYAAEALGKIGRLDISFTLSRLLPALDDPSPYVRAMMVEALGELQDASARDSIRKFLYDKDETVRGMAKWALKQIENSQ